MDEVVFIIEEDQAGGYTARAISQSIFTEADTIEELKNNILEAFECNYSL